MKKQILWLPILAFCAALFSCGTYEIPGREIQSDKGTPIQYIDMEKSVSIPGIIGVSKYDLIATCGPSMAQNKEIIWSSSDEKIVSIKPSGNKCTLTLMNKGEATITAANYLGTVKAECLVKCSLVTIIPYEIQSVSGTVYANNVDLAWKTPKENADYLDGVFVEVYEGSSSDGNLIKEERIKEDEEKDKEYSARIKGLEPETQYFIQVYTAGKNGEKSSNAAGKAFTTIAADEASPKPVENLELSSVSLDSFTLTWQDSTTEDYFYALVEAIPDSPNAPKVEPAEVKKGVQTYTFKGLSSEYSYTFKVTAVDDNYNQSEAQEVRYSFDSKTTASKVVVDNSDRKWSGVVSLTWQDPKARFNYLKVRAASEGRADVVSEEITAGKNSYVFENLLGNVKYAFTVETYDFNDEKIAESAPIYAYAPLVTIRFFNKKTSGFMLPKNETEISNAEGSNDNYYARWAKVKALDGSADFIYNGDGKTGRSSTFSLMAVTKEKVATGKYFYITNVDPLTEGENGKKATAGLALKGDIENLTLASMYLAACNETGHNSVRFTNVSGTTDKIISYQFGATNINSAITYRTSPGSPGYFNWCWKVTEEDETIGGAE